MNGRSRQWKRADFVLLTGAGLLALFLSSGNSGTYVVKADGVRLMDIFHRFTIDRTLTRQARGAAVPKDSEGEATGEAICGTSINLDFIKGSPAHPLKLKCTKNPDNGSPLGRQTRNAILATPPTRLSLKLRLEREYTLQFEFGIISRGWTGEEEGIRFSIMAEDLKNGSVENLFSETLHPGKRPLHRRWVKGRVDLSAYSGKTIELRFDTSALGSSLRGQAAVWGNPVLAAEDAEPRLPNIILISADTLRPDHLGCYGYARETTPALDRLAAESCRFSRVISQAPYTLSSHMSILTSRYPSFHKVNRITADKLDSQTQTLAEALYNRGYRTWAITGGGQVSSDYGFAEGFESYLEFTSAKDDVKKKVALTKEFMRENGKSPVFVFFHTYKPHSPFQPLPPYDTMFDPEYTGILKGDIPTITAINMGKIQVTRADLDHLVALYDGEIREMDDQLNELFTFLGQERTAGASLIIFTSDHGEEFGEHGLYGVHSHTLYQELVCVPLIVFVPETNPSGRVIDDQVRSIDIYPTILELVGVKPRRTIQGRSLVALMKNGRRGERAEPAFSERVPEDSPWIRSLRTGEYTYMFREDMEKRTSRHLFFNLRRDPTEQASLEIRDDRVRSLFDQIRFLIAEGKKPGKTRGDQEMDPETREILRTLGYIK
jgi:arylsulfatase A-like enzyme